MSLEAYDEGLLKYLKSALSFDNIINSAESKAFDNIAENYDDSDIRVPMISFWRISNPVIEGGGNYAARSRGRLMSKDFDSCTGDVWRTLPIELTYQITIWSDRRREVDDIYRELIMYLMTDNPQITIQLEGMQEPYCFDIQVTDSDSGTDVDSFSDRGRIYTQNIMITILEAQLFFSRKSKLAKDIGVRLISINSKNEIE